MRVIIESDSAAAASTAADFIAKQIRRCPSSVLGLATGGTPVQCYQQLIQRHREGQLDFSDVTTFNLDEYLGLAPDHPQSYHSFMQAQLFSHVNLDTNRCHLPNGLAADITAACIDYEQKIADAGGIDLQLLGIGRDGHIAFNEPGSSLAGRTRIKHLTQETIDDNARFFDRSEDVPKLAVTMGVGTIMEARCCLLLATGQSKAEAIAAAVEGPITASITASALQLHPHAIFVLDEAAASQLERADYYRMSETAQRELESALENA